LLVAVLLAAATPAAIQAVDAAQPSVSVAGATPLDTNLLRNGGFETKSTDGSIPRWTVTGDVHVEKFGDRAWPTPAYGQSHGGGKRYLACGTSSGTVTQTVPFTGWEDRDFKIKAHLQVDIGGKVGQSVRVTIRATGSGPEKVVSNVKTLPNTNHYTRGFATLGVPDGADQLEATVEIIGSSSGAKCRVVADTVKLYVFRP
jgi:hypothetical protein